MLTASLAAPLNTSVPPLTFVLTPGCTLHNVPATLCAPPSCSCAADDAPLASNRCASSEVHAASGCITPGGGTNAGGLGELIVASGGGALLGQYEVDPAASCATSRGSMAYG